MDRIVQSYMNDFLKSQQITDKDVSKQFELFATYCVISQQYSEVFDLNDISTGAGGDCGIDSVAILANGCQTSHVIFYNKDNIKNELQIPIKLIETIDEDTVNKIIKATNRQTEVSDEQLVALNEFHKNLEAFYLTFSGQERLYYERRSKQYNYTADIEKVRIVSISTQIKATASMFFDKPHLASRYYGRLLKSVDGIFNKQHKLLPYYTSAYLLYKLEYLFRNKMIPMQYRKYRFFILMLIKYDMSDKKMPELNSKKMENLCNKILKFINDNEKLVKEVEKVIGILDKYISQMDSSEATKSATLVDQLKSEYVKK